MVLVRGWGGECFFRDGPDRFSTSSGVDAVSKGGENSVQARYIAHRSLTLCKCD